MRSPDERPARPTEPRREEVDESSEESFPASDPPSWEPLHSGTPVEQPARGASGERTPDEKP